MLKKIFCVAAMLFFANISLALIDNGLAPTYLYSNSCIKNPTATTYTALASEVVSRANAASKGDCDMSTNLPGCSTNPISLISVTDSLMTYRDACVPTSIYTHAISKICPEGYTLDTGTNKCMLADVSPDVGPDQDCPKPTAGNPILLADANKHQQEIDFRGGGEFPLEVVRYYNSDVDLTYGNNLNTMGYRWRLNYDRSLFFDAATPTTITAVRASGAAFYFVQSGGVWSAGDDVHLSLSAISGGWILKDPVIGITERYSSTGILTEIENISGLKHTLAYDSSKGGMLATVTHSNGQVITFQHLYEEVTINSYVVQKSKKITGFSDPDSNSYSYTYVGGGLDKVTYPDSSERSYVYSGDLLTQIKEDGTQYAGWVYNGSSEAIETYHGSVSQKYERMQLTNIATNSTTVRNANNQDTVYHFENILGQKRLVRVEGQSSGSCAPSDSHITYDADGFRNTVTEGVNLSASPANEGIVTSSRYDDPNWPHLVTTKITGLKWSSSAVKPWSTSGTFDPAATDTQPEAQKTETDWHADLAIPTEKRYFGRNIGNSAWVKHRTVAYTYDDNNVTDDCSNAASPTHRVCTVTVTDNLNTVSRVWTYDYTMHTATGKETLVDVQTIDGPLSGTGDTTTYNFTTSGQLESVVFPTVNSIAQTTSYANYNGFGLPENITDANGIETVIGYDARGRVETITADDGGIEAETTLTYYPNGLLQKMTQPDGSYLEYFYNDAHHLIGLENNHGDYIEYTPSLLDGQWTVQEVCTAGDSSSGCTGDTVAKFQRVFDALGRVSKIKDASNDEKEVFGYDTNNNLTTRTLLGDDGNDPTHDDNDLATVHEYDALNRLIRSVGSFDCGGACSLNSYNNFSGTVPASPETEYAYNGQGLVSRVTDANGHYTDFTYNGFGELVEEVSPDRGTTTYAYDAAGNLITKTDARSKVTKYQYDNLNRLTGIDYGYSSSFSADVTYTYDEYDTDHGKGKGRLTSVADLSGTTDYKYDALGRIIKKTLVPVSTSLSLETEYAYNSAGTLEQVIYPNDQVALYDDDDGRFTGVDVAYDGSSQSNDIHTISYAPFGGVNSLTRNLRNPGDTMVVTRDYDTANRLSSIGLTVNGDGPITASYGYDAFNNIVNIAHISGASESFTYDPLQRLAQATGQYGRYTYTYDNVGNRITQKLERAPIATPTSFADVFTETYLYDGQAQTTDSKTNNRLKSVTRKLGSTTLRTRTFEHDAAGNTTEDETVKNATTTTVELDYGDDNRLQNVDVQ